MCEVVLRGYDYKVIRHFVEHSLRGLLFFDYVPGFATLICLAFL